MIYLNVISKQIANCTMNAILKDVISQMLLLIICQLYYMMKYCPTVNVKSIIVKSYHKSIIMSEQVNFLALLLKLCF